MMFINLNNDHTRPAYARACSRFFAFCEDRGLSLAGIRPFGVAVWVKLLDSIPTETLRDLRDRALIATREPDRG
jgi:hypothetical protein